MRWRDLNDQDFLAKAIARAQDIGSRLHQPQIGQRVLHLPTKQIMRIASIVNAETYTLETGFEQVLSVKRSDLANPSLLFHDLKSRRNSAQILRAAGFPEAVVKELSPENIPVNLNQGNLPGLALRNAAPTIQCPDDIDLTLPPELKQKRLAISNMIKNFIAGRGTRTCRSPGEVKLSWLKDRKRLEISCLVDEDQPQAGPKHSRIYYQISPNGRILAINSFEVSDTELPNGHYEAVAKILHLGGL